MLLSKYLETHKISVYKLSKESGVPYMTLNDLCNEKSSLAKSSAETVFRIANALGISMEELLKTYMKARPSFENFKSDMCQKLKQSGDVRFIRYIIESHVIEEYYEDQWYPEAFYMLAMLDYLSRENDIPLCNDYESIRSNNYLSQSIPQV